MEMSKKVIHKNNVAFPNIFLKQSNNKIMSLLKFTGRWFGNCNIKFEFKIMIICGIN